MGNSLNEDIEGKVIVFKQEWMTVPATEHPFRVRDGFGTKPSARGTALFGEFLADGEEARMEGYQVERYATEEEIQAAEAKRNG